MLQTKEEKEALENALKKQGAAVPVAAGGAAPTDAAAGAAGAGGAPAAPGDVQKKQREIDLLKQKILTQYNSFRGEQQLMSTAFHEIGLRYHQLLNEYRHVLQEVGRPDVLFQRGGESGDEGGGPGGAEGAG